MLDLSGVPLLNIAIGVMFLFLVLSVIASSIAETISTALKLRAKTLEDGLRVLLGEDGNAKGEQPKLEKFFADWRISSLSQGVKGRPSYIDPRTAARVLLDTLAPPAQDPSKDLIKKAATEVAEVQPGSVQEWLAHVVQEVGADRDEVRKRVEVRFNEVMDRVTGWYKRRIRLILFLIGVVIAIGLNADVINVADRLARDEPLRAQVVQEAQDAAKDPSTTAPANTPAGVEKRIEDARATALPLGWGAENRPHGSFPSWDWVLKLAGLLLTAIAISFGSKTWFDILGRFVNLRGTGNRIGTPKNEDLAPDDRDARPAKRATVVTRDG